MTVLLPLRRTDDMKKKFPTYYRPSADKKKELFNDNDCYFVFDTNALLDLYRLGKDTTDKVLSLIEKYKSRIVIPYHVAEEYHTELLNVITKRIASYNDLVNNQNEEQTLSALCETLKLNELPSMKEKLKKLLGDPLKKFFKEVDEERNYLKEQFQSWSLQDKISDSLGDMVLDSFTEEEIEAIETEGEKRYEHKIPPGYKDLNKDSNKYGDLIIWKEILRFAKSKNCSIIFISRDLKEDWILRCNGMDCGPKQELIEEFSKDSKGSFLTCTLDKFLEYANIEQKVFNEDDLKKAMEMLALGKTLNEESLKNVYVKEMTAKDIAKAVEGVNLNELKTLLPDEIMAQKSKEGPIGN